jgi:putative MATE family efflux protein
VSEETAATPEVRAAGWRDRDLTQGRLLPALATLALPLVASSLLGGVLFQLCELTFVSRLGESAVAAVMITNQTLRQVLLMLVMGASFATQSLVARAIGAGERERAEHFAGQSLALGAGVALFSAAAGALAPEWLFSLGGPAPQFYEQGVPYVRWVFLLQGGLVFTMLFGAILGGAGDTTTPLLVQIVQTAAGIAASYLLIFGHAGLPTLGVRGAALGVAVGQAVALCLGARVLFGGRARIHLRGRHLVPDPHALWLIARIAGPSALQMLGGVVTTFVFIRLAGRFGEGVQAAYAIGLRLGTVVPMICFPLAGAVSTLVGQALGAGDLRRAWRAIGVGVAVHGSLMLAFALAVALLRVPLMESFSDDPEVVRVGTEYLLYAAGSFAFLAFHLVFMRALQGAGEFFVPMCIALGSTFAVTIPAGLALAAGPRGSSGIWLASVIGSAASAAGTGMWLAAGRWARRTAQSPPT